MNSARQRVYRVLLILMTGVLLAACGSSGGEEPPTLSVEQIQTQAVGTFSAGLTATALAMPTNTPTATEEPTATATSTQAATNTVATTATSAAPTSSCYNLTYVSDVTIPDDTEMDPGETFTKTWRVRNSGSCRWENDFLFNFIGGEAMGGSSQVLDDIVDPGENVDLSVSLTAPSDPGTYRGNWRMSTADKAYFGDEVYVQIIVGSVPTATVTPTPTP
ncbi:MAG: NBR1-Ig-like domain-containing protein [Anaerolineales bacterium]